MPRGLTLSQRLTRPDGLPTVAARVGVVALMAVAAAAGYAAGPDGAAQDTRGAAPVAISRLSGDIPIVTPESRPELRAAAALPAIPEPARRRSAPSDARAVATPAPSATPAASATPAPSATAPFPAATPAPPAPAADPAPRRAPAPTESFDSSG